MIRQLVLVASVCLTALLISSCSDGGTKSGYEVNLFASEPMFANPIHMVWDSKGRLWVACSWAYPQLKPGQKANDKIIILEDTDGDGRHDKRSVFYDKLEYVG